GQWYAVMLGSRLVDGVAKNLGRETFICPVIWERGWPLFSPETGKVEPEYDAPELPWTEFEPKKNFYDFEDEKLELEWVFYGRHYEKIHEIKDSRLYLNCVKQPLVTELEKVFGKEKSTEKFAAFLGQRQINMNQTVSCQMTFVPKNNETAGLAVVQALNHELVIERALIDSKQVLRAVAYTSEVESFPWFPDFKSSTKPHVVATVDYDNTDVVIEVAMKGEDWTVSYGPNKEEMTLLTRFDGVVINPEHVGCMCGTMIGMFASANGDESENKASFDWYKIV
ncbi:MAG: glycoside hydrolase family 43 protein, partial [Blautia sp.]|nr:glycoside hydrolase family 43 protein [Blautia sp.]